MTPWIIDASLAMTWYLADEVEREYGLWVLDCLSSREVRVPGLFIYEFSNAIVTAHRRNRISADDLEGALKDISSLNLAIDTATQAYSERLGALALRHGLTCYDAAYLDLGLRTGFPIATLDKALVRAMQVANVDFVHP